jgi:hypothetical protein
MSELEIGDYVLATKWHDGDPHDHWAVGFYDGKVKGNRYLVIDNNGDQFRRIGFRRIKKISANRGNWLVKHTDDIQSGSHSLWWWVRAKMGKEV